MRAAPTLAARLLGLGIAAAALGVAVPPAARADWHGNRGTAVAGMEGGPAGTVAAGGGTGAAGIAAGVAVCSSGCHPSTHRLRCTIRRTTIRRLIIRRRPIRTAIRPAAAAVLATCCLRSVAAPSERKPTRQMLAR